MAESKIIVFYNKNVPIVPIKEPERINIIHKSTYGSLSGMGPIFRKNLITSKMQTNVEAKVNTIAKLRSLRIVPGMAKLLTEARMSEFKKVRGLDSLF